MLDAGAIHLSQSPWYNVVVLVRKKDGTLCFCVDVTTSQHVDEEGFVPSALYPRGIGKHGRVSTFLVNGFQVRLLANKDGSPESQQYMAFMVGNPRFYEFTHMLFRLCNAPVTFQFLMQNMLGELNLTYCVVYLDDVIIFGCME